MAERRGVTAVAVLVILSSGLIRASSAAGGSCASRGYTTCPNVCCGAYSSSGEAACCLQANATCCNKPELGFRSVRFFCCPPELPKCDYEFGTCRSAKWNESDAVRAAEEQRDTMDLYRAQNKYPRHSYQGTSFAGSSVILNKHLRRSGGVSVRACSSFALHDLHRVQGRIYRMRRTDLDDVYQSSTDKRRLTQRSLAEYEALWSRERELVERYPSLLNVVRDGRCHEAVMWFVHHLPTSMRSSSLDSAELPLLPLIRHFDDEGQEKEGLLADGVPPNVADEVQQIYEHQVHCSTCHVAKRPTLLPASTTTCPAITRPRCMELHRLKCNDSAENTDQHCCAGLRCKQWYVPASEVSFAMNTTRCVRLPTTQAETEKAKVSDSKPQVAGTLPTPPVLARSWSGDCLYRNLTDDDPKTMYGTAKMLFEENGFGNLTSIRVDFGPVCPFKQLWAPGIEANYGPCSVVFRNTSVIYAYPQAGHACVFCYPRPFAAWQRDFLCASNSTFRRVVLNRLGGDQVESDLWELEWWWKEFGVFRNFRNWYFKAGTNIPVRVAEDLDTGYNDVYNFTTYDDGLSDSVFTAPFDGLKLHYIGYSRGQDGCPEPDERFSVPKGQFPPCTFDQSDGMRRSWPYSSWP